MKNQNITTPKTFPRPPNHRNSSSLRDHRIYKEVSFQNIFAPQPSLTKNPKQKTKTTTNPQTQETPPLHRIDEPIPDFFDKNPSEARLASSRLLGEETVATCENLIAEDIDNDFALTIKGHSSHDHLEKFKNSVIVVAMSSQSSSEILKSILAEGVNNLVIKPMGGLQHLITFESMEDKQAMLDSCWLDRWFIEISEVDESTTSRWRQTTLSIYGVPLATWNYENFTILAVSMVGSSQLTTPILHLLR